MARHPPARGSFRPSRPGQAAKVKPKPNAKAKPAAKAKPKRAPALADRIPTVLTAAQARFLRGQAHDLKALLQVGGKGVSDALLAEIDSALEHHELIKLKIAAEDRDARDAMIAAVVDRSRAALVQRIGHVAVLYRPSEDQRRIVLPRN